MNLAAQYNLPYGFIMRRKYFAGNFSACVITNMNIFDKSCVIRNIH